MAAHGAVRRTLRWSAAGVLGAALMVSGACTLDEVDIPKISGPSTTGVSLILTANPDWLRADGVSTSVIVVNLRDYGGQPIAGRTIVLGIGDEQGRDAAIGSLSVRTVVSGTDGRAQAVYTAPVSKEAAAHQGVMVKARPQGTDYAGEFERAVMIELIPMEDRRYPPDSTNCPVDGDKTCPVCTFITEPRHGPFFVGVPIRFQSTSFDSNGYLVRYEWHWDDGTANFEYGPEKYHTFGEVGRYWVFHSVTDNEGAIDSTNQQIDIEPAP
jgi:hypothetical protein